jgi:hypothetical protein
MTYTNTRRQFLRELGVSAASLPFLYGLPSLGLANHARPKQRLIIMFSPNGIVPKSFWPDQPGTDFALKESLHPLEPLKHRTLILHGVHDLVQGDGDNHMRGIGCLLTGTRLFPGNVQGGSDTPAGWSSGISIDQEIKNFLQQQPATRTRFGSLEFGVMVPKRADTWTRMSYAGPNRPLAPIDAPEQMFNKLYGQLEDQASLGSVLDDLTEDMDTIRAKLSAEDRQLIEAHTTWVREKEQELKAAADQPTTHQTPDLDLAVEVKNDNMPQVTNLQLDLLVNSFKADFARVATLQFTNSVGQARMRWLGIDEGHHTLSHEPDKNDKAQEQLTQINRWYCEQLAALATRLESEPEPGGNGSMLDHTTIVWTNELGKGNSHTMRNIPFVLVGGGLGFRMGQALQFDGVPHNRLLLSLAHGFGHHLETFGRENFCGDGPLSLS